MKREVSFSGALSTTVALPDAVGGERFAARGQMGAFVRRATGVDVREEGEAVCIACGAPRFEDRAYADLARERGPAAAWHAALRERGAQAVERVRGRFSVVLVDSVARRVVMATDLFATWPLCYALLDDGIGFAQRADEVPGSARRISHQAVFDYLYFHVIPGPETIYADVVRLGPAHVLEWTPDGLSRHPYWRPVFLDGRAPDLADSKREFRELLEASVASEAANGRVGAFLSGGTDSSSVAGFLCKALGAPADTYSIGFDAAGYDEMSYARIAAQHFGTKHHEYYVTAADVVQGIPQVAAHYDQPFGNSSAVPAFICASRARGDGIEKLLAGDGGDELFGGNTRYAKQKVFEWYDAFPAPLRRGVLTPFFSLAAVERVPLLKKGSSYVRGALTPLPDRFEVYNLLTHIGIRDVLCDDFVAGIREDRPGALQRQVWDSIEARSLIDRMLAYDWKFTLVDNDLPKVVGTTELAGVDVGFPMLADELVDFSLRIPHEWKLKGLRLRWFFKEALREFLPDEIIRKKKHGFGLPFGVWLSRDPTLRAFALGLLDNLRQRRVVRGELIDTLLTERLKSHPGYYGEMVFILLTLEAWLEHHAPDWKAT